jgi:hypothetical protein
LLPANYSNNFPESRTDFSYSQDAWVLWGARTGYIAAVFGLFFFALTSAELIREANYPLLFKGMMYIVIVVVAMISARDTIYRINVVGDRLLLQTAFSKKEYRVSELKDVYKKGDIQGGFVWTIRTSDCDYKFQAKKEQARKIVEALLTRIPAPPSASWSEYRIPEFTEKRFIGMAIFFLLCVGIASLGTHSGMLGVVFLLVLVLAVSSLTRFVRQVKIDSNGLIVENLLRQEKLVPWKSITSVRRTRMGAIFLASSQGRFALSALDGSNILLRKTVRNIAPNFFIDELNPAPKLNQNK